MRSGILWFIFTGLQSVLVNTMMRTLNQDFGYHPFQLVFFYSAMAACLYIPSVIRNPSRYRPVRKMPYLVRGFCEVVAFSCIFYALSRMPFAMLTVLSFIMPIFGSFAAIWFLGEQMNKRKWIGLGLGFLGICIIANPDTSNVGWAVLLPIASAAIFSICVVCIRSLAQTDPPARVAFVTLVLMATFSLPLAATHWQTPALAHIPWLLVLAAQVASVQLCAGKALQKIDLTTAQPFMFLNLIWASIVGYLLFDEIVSWTTALGAVIIICGIVYSVRHHTTRLDPLIGRGQGAEE